MAFLSTICCCCFLFTSFFSSFSFLENIKCWSKCSYCNATDRRRRARLHTRDSSNTEIYCGFADTVEFTKSLKRYCIKRSIVKKIWRLYKMLYSSALLKFCLIFFGSKQTSNYHNLDFSSPQQTSLKTCLVTKVF